MIYFTSDWHIDETRITKEFNPFFRPFSSISEQNQIILNNAKAIIKSQDVLYHLGDVSMTIDGIACIDQIKCASKHLIIGNYDEDKIGFLAKHFDTVSFSKYVELSNGFQVFCTHYPASAMEQSSFGIVGHIHGLWKVQPNMINVSVDAWHFKPVSEDEIIFAMHGIKNHYDKNVFPYCPK